jgi:uncharacterized protein (TIGR03083 family)
MVIDRYADHIERDADLILRAADWAGLDALVPTCPPWTVRSLLQHVTKVHHWVSAILHGADHRRFVFDRPQDDDLVKVFLSGVDRLSADLRSAPDTLDVWTFLPPAEGSGSAGSAAAHFWARRQAHETAIHRVDAQLAADYGVSDFDVAFAADGLEELLVEFVNGRFTADGIVTPFSVTFTPLDLNRAWTVLADPAGLSSVAEARGDSDLIVFGNASELYRWAWNRADDQDVTLRGDLRVADEWRARFAVGAR